jgi:hypothetical protein
MGTVRGRSEPIAGSTLAPGLSIRSSNAAERKSEARGGIARVGDGGDGQRMVPEPGRTDGGKAVMLWDMYRARGQDIRCARRAGGAMLHARPAAFPSTWNIMQGPDAGVQS